jgi:hypothetical protein
VPVPRIQGHLRWRWPESLLEQAGTAQHLARREDSHERSSTLTPRSAANAASDARSTTCGRLYVYDTLLQRLAQHLEHVAVELGQFIQEEHAVMGQRHLPRRRDLAAPDQPRVEMV